MLVSKEKIEQADSNNNKPAITTKLSNDPPTDDKPISQNSKDKSESSDQGKPTKDNPPVGGFGQQIGNNDEQLRTIMNLWTPTLTQERTLIPMRRIHSPP